MNDIRNLEPTLLWKHFYALTQIPRPSKKEEKVIEYVKHFAQSNGLEVFVDEVQNVIVRKPASAGMEDRLGVVLQGHLDMVPQKNGDKVHDFEKDPIETWIDGDWVKAKGTTLGADNGIGVAATLAILEDKNLVHGPLEALFTIDEETGMTGAFGLTANTLKGDILLNLDSEDEGELYVGCAGGINANMAFKYTEEAVPAGMNAFKLIVKGLKGGHSGLEIILGRGNANKLMNRFMKHAGAKHEMRISHIDGGSLRNAIPRESTAIVVVPQDRAEGFRIGVLKHEHIYKHELAGVEPDFSFTVESCELPKTVIDKDTQKRLINAIYACPNGVIRMSDAMPNLVETSTNLASVKFVDGEIKICCLLRSSVDSAKADLGDMVSSVFELAGAEAILDGDYPGWKPNMNSLILKTAQETYNKKFGKVPEIKAIHAGLECGLLGGIYPKWDMLSFGPTIRYPHSPDEKVNVPSVAKFWEFLTDMLHNIPKK